MKEQTVMSFDKPVVDQLVRIGRRIGVENNPVEVVRRALALFDEISESIAYGAPVVISADHPMLQSTVELKGDL